VRRPARRPARGPAPQIEELTRLLDDRDGALAPAPGEIQRVAALLAQLEAPATAPLMVLFIVLLAWDSRGGK
jgi:hypothetical protein